MNKEIKEYISKFNSDYKSNLEYKELKDNKYQLSLGSTKVVFIKRNDNLSIDQLEKDIKYLYGVKDGNKNILKWSIISSIVSVTLAGIGCFLLTEGE